MRVPAESMEAFFHARRYTERHIAEAILRGDEESEWRARRQLAMIHLRFTSAVSKTGEWK